MEPIAIVGMACRLPGAPSLDEFWSLLHEGQHGIDLIPESRWERECTFDSDATKAGKINTQHGGFIQGIDLFDNQFFRISAEEARQMDPQQRIMLELTAEAFADAGISPLEVDGTDTAVFVGVMTNEYLRLQTEGEFRRVDHYTGAGSGYSMIANRISYQFNLQGPSMAVDSACSSSLLGTFLACQSLWNNECSLAIAGGVNLILSPALSMFYTRAGLSAADGKCRTLSRDASGMGRGEGAGIVLLKRLSDAVRDGNPTYAVIRGGAVNHNGRGNGMSAPNRWAQQLLLRKAYEHAGVNTGDLDYVELHGTGTLIGDAIEATALGSVLAEKRREGPCRVGSVKTNLGHLEGAAGVAGLIKLALCLHHGKLAPSLWYAGPNPHAALDTLPLEVQSRLQDWPEHGRQRLAAISSFGLGGANAHLVLQSAPAPRRAPLKQIDHYLLHLSARSEAALAAMSSRYHALIEGMPPEKFSAFCLATLVRAQGHEHRATFAASSQEEMKCLLSRFTYAKYSPPGVFTGRHSEGGKQKRFFIFPDWGPADFRAIAGFSQIHISFRNTLTECDQALEEVLAGSLEFCLAQLCEGATHVDGRVLPFVHFGVQLALARLWQTAGLEPDAVVGTGMGQLASWVISGAVTVQSAIARIAALNDLELTAAGALAKSQRRPFAIDCYSSAGKNIMSEDLCHADTNQSGDFPDSLPELPRRKAADYFVQSLNGVPAGFFGVDAECVASPPNCQKFWLELARLTIRHNVRWKNLLPNPMSIRLPQYPWQRSHFWLDSEGTAKIPVTAGQDASASQAGDEEDRQNSNSENSSSGKEKVQEDVHVTAIAGGALAQLSRGKLLDLPEAERRSAIAVYIKQKVAEVLRLPSDAMEESETFTGLGLDSLSALRLKNRVEADLKTPVSLMKLLDGSIEDFARDLLSHELETPRPAVSPEPAACRTSPTGEYPADYELGSEITEIPPEEIERLLHAALSGEAAQELTAALH